MPASAGKTGLGRGTNATTALQVAIKIKMGTKRPNANHALRATIKMRRGSCHANHAPMEDMQLRQSQLHANSK